MNSKKVKKRKLKVKEMGFEDINLTENDKKRTEV